MVRRSWHQDPCTSSAIAKPIFGLCKAPRKGPRRHLTALIRPSRRRAPSDGPKRPGPLSGGAPKHRRGGPVTVDTWSWDLGRSPSAGRCLRCLLRSSLTDVWVRSVRCLGGASALRPSDGDCYQPTRDFRPASRVHWPFPLLRPIPEARTNIADAPSSATPVRSVSAHWAPQPSPARTKAAV